MFPLFECEVCGERDEVQHEHEVMVVRQGAALRTGDELGRLFIDDVSALIDEPVPDEVPNPDGWLDDPDEQEVLYDFQREWEEKLGEHGYAVVWDDGYVIYRLELTTAGV